MEPTNIEKLLKTPMEELKYHELQQLEEHLKAANEKVEAVAKLQKERGPGTNSNLDLDMSVVFNRRHFARKLVGLEFTK
ncbi:hypothetical protein EJD97_016794 [Solanum chilense]|uniref:Uncharacterized protein n=1 Tax=Solanum chilense TaxID=4083 RepID=A0A6N2B4A9_SOLCI|nr:hypothetical protein EJD97_016794 [Solanum chilense]